MMTKLLTFEALRFANVQRNKEWDPDNKLNGTFRGLELSGEIGELIEIAIKVGRLSNSVKKLERENLGLPGSIVKWVQLADEMADVQITLDLLAMHYSIDLAEATKSKFNRTSMKIGLITRIT